MTCIQCQLLYLNSLGVIIYASDTISTATICFLPAVKLSQSAIRPLFSHELLERSLGLLCLYIVTVCRLRFVKYILTESPDCKTRYHVNYYVHDHATIRTYYAGNFKFLQTSQHILIATELCELFVNMMVSSWYDIPNIVSYTDLTCLLGHQRQTVLASMYNTGLSNDVIRDSLPATTPMRLELDTRDVWNGFFLHSLLLDHAEKEAILEVQHNAPSQAERLQPQLKARNLRMIGPGQEHWNHICDLCCHIKEDKDGAFCKSSLCSCNNVSN
jgi:CxC5 like cysteine cluster associated with KDZ transposases